MAKTKEEKQKALDKLKENLEKQKALVLVDYSGLKADDIFDFRERLKESDCSLIVAKKTLVKLAFKEKKIEIEDKSLEGQLALVFGFKDEVLPAKISYNFSQENENLKILGGFVENRFKTVDEINVLAKIPSKEELYARVVGSISAPISNFVRVLQGNIKGLVYILANAKI